jgi:hypothetical protein
MFGVIVLGLVIIYLFYGQYKSIKSNNILFKQLEYEAENINNHRLTFHCMCEDCVKKYGP